MKRIIPLSLIGSAIVLCLAATTGQAAVSGVRAAAPAAAHASIVSKTGWHLRRHHRHCWWSHHHRHCR
ncbi:MAG: hypothetical protein Q8K85_16515 [Hyphomicrobium sp.]|nr:hypothetical protein [Hyphomicrobium sp.]